MSSPPQSAPVISGCGHLPWQFGIKKCMGGSSQVVYIIYQPKQGLCAVNIQCCAACDPSSGAVMVFTKSCQLFHHLLPVFS